MATPEAPEITQLLLAWNQGEEAALQELIPLVQQELRKLARRYLRRERSQPFQTTELVNEAYLKLVDCERVRWQDRAHFFAIAAQMMRRILVDIARSRGYEKRGGSAAHLSFDDAMVVAEQQAPDWVALDDALDALAVMDPRKARVVEMRFFGGLKIEEVAEVLGVSEETVNRDWRFAKSWLRRELSQTDGAEVEAG